MQDDYQGLLQFSFGSQSANSLPQFITLYDAVLKSWYVLYDGDGAANVSRDGFG